MKNIMKSLALVAVAAMSFVSCSNNFEDVNVSDKTFQLTISSEKPALENDSRTEFSNGSVIWDENDGVRACYYHTSGVWSKYYASTKTELEGTKAKFSFTGYSEFKGETSEGTYTFYAGYPKNAIGGIQQTDAPTNGELSVVLPTKQSMPKAGTFDANADIMLGVAPDVVAAPVTEISVMWNRLVAHGCVTLKNLPAKEGEKVYSVTFTAPEDVKLTGNNSVNFIDEGFVGDFDDNTVVVALPDNTFATSDVVVWFCSAPATIASGKNLTVTVETSRGTYTNSITARAEGIKFLQNRYNTLGINMESAEFTPAAVSSDVWAKVTSLADVTEGTYVIVANGYYCPNDIITNNNIPQAIKLSNNNVAIDGNNLVGTVADGMKWTFSGTANAMTITKFNDTKVLYLTADSKGTRVGTTDDGLSWNITVNDDETFNLVYPLDGPRCLTLYNSADWRSYQTSASAQSAQVRKLNLYKLQVPVDPNAPSLSVAQTTVELENTECEGTVVVNSKNIATINAESNADWLLADIEDGNLYYIAEANEGAARTATVTLSAEGVADVVVTFNQKAAAAAGIQKITVAEFLSKEDTATTFELTGKITRVVNTSYGNFDLTDATGTVYVYGLLTPDGQSQKQWAAAGLNLGDTITIQGVYSVYNGAPQIKNAVYVSSVQLIQRNFAFDKTMVTLNFGDAFEQPKLTGTKLDDVTYASDNTEVATVNATTGAVEIVGVGTAMITATAPETETHATGSASYTITVNEAGSTIVEGGRDDFSTVPTNTSYGTRTSTAGWVGKNCAVVSGGTSDNNPKFKMLGSNEATRGFVINGKTSAVGTITSPTLETGCGVLSFKYGLPYSDTKIKFRVDIKQNGAVVKTFTVDKASASQKTVYSHEETVNVAGDFQIVITNLSPSNSGSNKDRTAIWDVIWTGYEG